MAVGAVAAVAVTAATGGAGAVALAGSAAGGAMVGADAQRGEITFTQEERRSNVASNLSAGGDFTARSAGDTVIIGSDIAADGNGDIRVGVIAREDGGFDRVNEQADLRILAGENFIVDPNPKQSFVQTMLRWRLLQVRQRRHLRVQATMLQVNLVQTLF